MLPKYFAPLSWSYAQNLGHTFHRHSMSGFQGRFHSRKDSTINVTACMINAVYHSCFSFGFQRTAGRLLSKGFSHSLSPVAGRLTTCAKVYRRPVIGGFCNPLISIPPLWPFMNTIREPYCATSIRRQRDEENPIIRAVPLTVGLKCALYCTVSSK